MMKSFIIIILALILLIVFADAVKQNTDKGGKSKTKTTLPQKTSRDAGASPKIRKKGLDDLANLDDPNDRRTKTPKKPPTKTLPKKTSRNAPASTKKQRKDLDDFDNLDDLLGDDSTKTKTPSKNIRTKTVPKKPSNRQPMKKRNLDDLDDLDVLLADPDETSPKKTAKKKTGPNDSNDINAVLANPAKLIGNKLFENDFQLPIPFIDPRRLTKQHTLRNIRQQGVGTGLKMLGKALSMGEDLSDFLSDSSHEIHNLARTVSSPLDALPIVGDIKRTMDRDITDGIELCRATKGQLLNSGSQILNNAGEHLINRVDARRLRNGTVPKG